MNIDEVDRYNWVHVWVGTNLMAESEYLKYFELDYSSEWDDPAYKICGFCKDIDIKWYDEDFIGIIPRKADEVGLDEILIDSAVAPEKLESLKERCANLGIVKANAIFWYSDGRTEVSRPIKNNYNGLKYLGLFEGE